MGSEVTRIFMFHRVVPDQPSAFGLPTCYRIRGTALTPAEFLDVVTTCGPVLPLEAIEEALRHRARPPGGTVLTFDDGYREHVDLVAPLLARMGCPGVFYVSSGLHGDRGNVAAVDAYYWILDNARRPMGRCALSDGTVFRIRVDRLQDKREWVTGAPKRALLNADMQGQGSLLASLAESLGVILPEDLAARLYMSPCDWRMLRNSGMRIGAHGVSHARLSRLPAAALADELADSIRIIGAIESAVSLAYPDGCYDSNVISKVAATGFSSAVTCDPGCLDEKSCLMRLPRAFVTMAKV